MCGGGRGVCAVPGATPVERDGARFARPATRVIPSLAYCAVTLVATICFGSGEPCYPRRLPGREGTTTGTGVGEPPSCRSTIHCWSAVSRFITVQYSTSPDGRL